MRVHLYILTIALFCSCTTRKNRAVLSEVTTTTGLKQSCSIQDRPFIDVLYMEQFLSLHLKPLEGSKVPNVDHVPIVLREDGVTIFPDFNENKLNYFMVPSLISLIESNRAMRDYWLEDKNRDRHLTPWFKDLFKTVEPNSYKKENPYLVEFHTIIGKNSQVETFGLYFKTNTTNRFLLPQKGQSLLSNPVPLRFVMSSDKGSDVKTLSREYWAEGNMFPKTVNLQIRDKELELTCTAPEVATINEGPDIKSEDIRRLKNIEQQVVLEAQLLQGPAVASIYLGQKVIENKQVSVGNLQTASKIACTQFRMMIAGMPKMDKNALAGLLQRYVSGSANVKRAYSNFAAYFRKIYGDETQQNVQRMVWNACIEKAYPNFVQTNPNSKTFHSMK